MTMVLLKLYPFFPILFVVLEVKCDQYLPPGTFTLELRSLERCEKVGTNDFNLDLHLVRKNAKRVNIEGNVTVTRVADRSVKLELILDKYGNGGWRKNAYIHRQDYSCETLYQFLGQFFKEMISHCIYGDCLKNEPSGPVCPMVKGIYEVKNLDAKKIQSINIPAGIAGRWRLSFNFLNHSDGKLLGCYRFIADCIQKNILTQRNN